MRTSIQVYGRKPVYRASPQSRLYFATSHCIVTDAGGVPCDTKLRVIQRRKPDQGSLESTEQLIREHAYRFFEERGCEHGHDLEDWLRAEAETLAEDPLQLLKQETGGGAERQQHKGTWSLRSLREERVPAFTIRLQGLSERIERKFRLSVNRVEATSPPEERKQE